MNQNNPNRKHSRIWLAVLAVALLSGLIWWARTPLWGTPDEPGHFLYARLLADLHRIPQRGDLSADVERPLLSSLEATGWWHYVLKVPPSPDLQRMAEDPLLAASGNQIGDEPPLYYIVPALMLEVGEEFLAESALALRVLRFWSLFLYLVTLLVSMVLATKVWANRPARILSLGFTVALLPMVGFMSSGFNNDMLAIAWGCLSFTLLMMPPYPRQWLWASLAIVSGPILVDRGLLFLWPTSFLWFLWRQRRARTWRWAVAACILVIVLLIMPVPRWAAGWERSPLLIPTRHSPQGLLLRDEDQASRVRISQFLADKRILALRGQQVRLIALVRGSGEGPLELRLADGTQVASTSCPISETPLACEVRLTLDPLASQIRTVAAIGERGDRSALGNIVLELSLSSAAGDELLANGQGTEIARLGSLLFPILEQNLPVPGGYFSRFFAPDAWNDLSGLRYILFAGFSLASFWGYFGWLTHPYPWWVYGILGLATMAAVGGLLCFGMAAISRRRRHAGTITDRLFAVSLLAVGFMLLQTWLPMVGQAWQPQGRYLLPALLPIAISLVLGWESMLPATWRPYLPHAILLSLLSLNLLAWSLVA